MTIVNCNIIYKVICKKLHKILSIDDNQYDSRSRMWFIWFINKYLYTSNNMTVRAQLIYNFINLEIHGNKII